MAPARTFTLQPHPTTPCAVVEALTATIAPETSGDWHLSFTLAGDVERLRVPPLAHSAAAADGLWQHTCFEAFIADPHSARYHEFNLSPSGEWAAYVFAAERLRQPDAALLLPPRIVCAHAARTLRLDARLPAAALPATTGGWLLGLSAVIESTDGALSYWALAHPAARPDFHQRAGWMGRLD
jgi:hypothetical protein